MARGGALKVAPKIPKLRLGGLGNGFGVPEGNGNGDDGDEVNSQDLNGLDSLVSGLSPSASSHHSRGFEAPFIFKVSDPAGNLHKVSASSERLGALKELLSGRLNRSADLFDLKYTDEDGDEVLVSGDAALSEAVDHARARGESFVRLTAKFCAKAATAAPTTNAAAAAAAAATSGGGAGSSGVGEGANGGPPPTPRERFVEAATQPSVMMLGGATAAAVLAVAGFVFMRRNRY